MAKANRVLKKCDHVKILSGDFEGKEGTVSGTTDDGKFLVKIGVKIVGLKCRTFRYNAESLEYIGKGGPCASEAGCEI